MYDLRMLIPILGIIMTMIPVAGLTLILTARFALRPMVETLAKALRESGFAGPHDGGEQIAELSEQVQLLTEEVSRLRQAQEFDRKLLGERAGVSPTEA